MEPRVLFRKLWDEINILLSDCLPEERKWFEKAKSCLEECYNLIIPDILIPVLTQELLEQLHWVELHGRSRLEFGNVRLLERGSLSPSWDSHHESSCTRFARELFEGAKGLLSIIKPDEEIKEIKPDEEIKQEWIDTENTSDEERWESPDSASTDSISDSEDDISEGDLPFAKW